MTTYLTHVPRRAWLLIAAAAVAIALTAALTIEPNTGGLADRAMKSAAPQPATTTTPVEQGYEALGAPESRTVTEDASTSSVGNDNVSVGGSVQAKDSVAGGAGITGSNPTELGLKILQNGSISIEVKASKFDRAYASARGLAAQLGGYVVASNISEVDGERRTGTVTLRVPNRSFDRALDRLDAGGKVTSLEVSSSDVTQEYVDARSRLRHDQAVEARLLQLLGRTKTVTEALVIQDRLDALQQTIEVEKGRINYLDKMTQLATIEVTISSRAGASDDDEGRSWGLGEAFDDAAHRFTGNIAGMVVGLGGALPALLVIGLGLLVGRRVMRGRAQRSGS